MSVQPKDGQADLLSYLVAQSTPTPLILKLFTNNISSITDLNVASDFTEATFTGYSNIVLTGSNWVITPSATNVDAFASYPEVSFTSTANQNQTVYGWYMVRQTTGKLFRAGLFSSPQVVTTSGIVVYITPKITVDSTLV